MLKYTIFALVLTVGYVQSFGAWKPIDNNAIPETVERVARWSLNAMNQKLIENGVEGSHVQMVGIKDAYSQLVAGTNYKFSLDTIYSENDKYYVSLF